MIKLTGEEKKLLKSYENGMLKSIPNRVEEMDRHQKYARTTLRKNMRVNIRLSDVDVQGIKKRAFDEGIPYQTLMSSVIHKYVLGKLIDKAA